MGTIADGIALFREEGPGAFLEGIESYFRWCLGQYAVRARSHLAAARGRVELSVGDASAEFFAGSTDSIAATLRRYRAERGQLAAVIKDVEEGDVFYDVGANTGLYTCLAADAGARVEAFEPYPPNVAELERNVAINDAAASVHGVALAAEPGTVGFAAESGTNLNDPGADSPGFGRGRIVEEGGDLEVPAVRGDDLIDDGTVPPPDVVKIDVEGAEELVVEGLAGPLQECRVVYCEVHDPPADGRPALVDRFHELGFDEVALFDTGKEEVVLRAGR